MIYQSKLNVFDKIKEITGKNPNLEIIDLKDKIKVENFSEILILMELSILLLINLLMKV